MTTPQQAAILALFDIPGKRFTLEALSRKLGRKQSSMKSALDTMIDKRLLFVDCSRHPHELYRDSPFGHYPSWLGLVPKEQPSGGRVIKRLSCDEE